MKKWISFIMILFLAFIFVGCGEDGPDNDDPVDGNTIAPTSIEVKGIVDGQTMEIDEQLELEIKVLPEDATNKNVIVKPEDGSILKVENNKKITALKAGETKITITPLGNTSLKKEFKVVVNGDVEVEEPVAPESLVLSGKAEVAIDAQTSLTITPTPSNASKEVTWSSSDESVATITNGIVKGIALGEAVITAVSTLNPEAKAEWKITVTEKQQPITVAPESIKISASETAVEVNGELQLTATVYPAGASQNVVWESLKPEYATVDSKGLVKGIASGNAYIVAHSEDGTVTSARFKIVVEKTTAPTSYPDLQGYQIVCMKNTAFDPNLDSYTGTDKLARQKAWAEVKELFNCDFLEATYPDEAPWGPERYKWVVAQAEVGQAQADFYQVPVGWLEPMIAGNAITNVDNLYTRFGKKEMSSVQKNASTIRGKLYGISEGVDSTVVYADLGIYYNYGMLQKYKIESPAKLFNEGKWSYSEFVAWVQSAQALLPEGCVVLSGHPYYYWLGMVNAGGVKIADTVTGSINVYDNAAIDAADKLRTLYLSGVYEKSPTWAEKNGAIFEQKALCSSGWFYFLRTSTRWAADMWGEDTYFGYVPFPWPDGSNKESSRVGTGGEEVVWTLATQRNSRPSYATDENLYRAMVELFRLTHKYEKEDASFDPDQIKRSSVSLKLDDPESIEAMIYYDVDKAIVEVCHSFYDSISGCPLTTNILNTVVSGNDYMTEMAADYETYENKFLSLYGQS